MFTPANETRISAPIASRICIILLSDLSSTCRKVTG